MHDPSGKSVRSSASVRVHSAFLFRRANVPHAKLQPGPTCRSRAARGLLRSRRVQRRERMSGGVPPSELTLHEGLQPRPEVGRCQLQREVSRPF